MKTMTRQEVLNLRGLMFAASAYAYTDAAYAATRAARAAARAAVVDADDAADDAAYANATTKEYHALLKKYADAPTHKEGAEVLRLGLEGYDENND